MTETRSPSAATVAPVAASVTFQRLGPLAAIVLAHIGVLYAIQSGTPRQSAHIATKEVIATFVAASPAPEPSRPQPAAPKPVPVEKKPTPRPKPVPTPVRKEPSPTAVTPPAAAPAAAEPATPAPAVAAAPSAPVASIEPKTVSSGIEYIQPPQPEHPLLSKRMGEQGKVVLRVLVNEKGRPEKVEVQRSSGFPRLDEAARQAAWRALFKPFIEDGKAVPRYAIVPIRFSLNN